MKTMSTLYVCLMFFSLPRSTCHQAPCSEVDYSGAYNNFGGWYNAPNISNENAFAALKVDGSITEWGSPDSGGDNDLLDVFLTA
jgi:hypothetical protein